jgi:uncharacterized DUF497 family protein
LVAEHGDKLWTAIFTHRDSQIRIISVRRARDNEKALYYKKGRALIIDI